MRWESLESTRGVRFLKQFGAERTGTNAINVMCRRAFGFNPLTNTFVKKHNSVFVDRFPAIDVVGFLISMRDPYAGALSYARWKKHTEMSPVWICGACDYWNHLYKSYLECHNCRMNIYRIFSDRLRRSAELFPVLVLTGPRQAGKTTLLRELFPNHNYASLDLPSLAEAAETDPDSFFKAYPPPVLIDEVQYAPGLFRHIKRLVDQSRD